MNVLKITREMLNANNEYIGATDVSDFDGAIEIEPNLGIVRFKISLRATKDIYAKTGSGIKTSGDIIAGEYIIAIWGDLDAGGNINAGSDVGAGGNIGVGGGIISGWMIEAGGDISAGGNINAHGGIISGGGISFGGDINP